MRDYACGGCKPVPFYGIHPERPIESKTASLGAVRTCNIFWRPQVSYLDGMKITITECSCRTKCFII